MAWYEELFADEDPLRCDLYIESETSHTQVDFLIEKLEIKPGDSVLDLCCGQGRHLIDLMRRGFDVTGVDLSAYMLGKCREAAAKEGLEPELINQDMRDINFTSRFDAAINMFTSFGYLESEEADQKVLDAVSQALKPGGRLLIDLMNRDWLMRNFKERDWQENDCGVIVVSEREFDSVTGRSKTREIAIHPDGRRVDISHSIRVYTYRELEVLLEKAGLTIKSVWGGFDSSNFTPTSRRMIMISKKQT